MMLHLCVILQINTWVEDEQISVGLLTSRRRVRFGDYRGPWRRRLPDARCRL